MPPELITFWHHFWPIVSGTVGWFWSWAGTQTGLVAVSGLFAAFFVANRTYGSLVGFLSSGGFGRFYHRLLFWFTGWLQDVFGPPRSGKAFGVCLTLAFLYPLILMLLAWAIGNVVPTVGGTQLLRPDPDAVSRFLDFVILISTFSALGLVLRWPEEVADWLLRPIVTRLFFRGNPPDWVSGLLNFFVIAAAVVGAVAFAFAGAVAGAVAVAFAVAFAFAGAVAFGFAFAFAGAGAVAVALAGAGAVLGALTGEIHASVTLLTLYMLIPLFNAAMDWASWIVTRWLLVGLQTAGLGKAVWHTVADVVAAIGFLALLAFSLPLMFTLANGLFGWLGWPPFDWQDLRDAAVADPLGGGLMVTGMLATTLIPTALHLLMVFLALLLSVGRHAPFWPWIEGLLAIENPDHWPRAAVFLWLGAVVLLSWFLLVVLGAALYALFAGLGLDGVVALLRLAEAGADLGAWLTP